MDGRISGSRTCTEKLPGHFRNITQKAPWDNVEKINFFQRDFLREEEIGINPLSSLGALIAAPNPFGEQIAVLCIFSNTTKIFAKGACKILISKLALLKMSLFFFSHGPAQKCFFFPLKSHFGFKTHTVCSSSLLTSTK